MNLLRFLGIGKKKKNEVPETKEKQKKRRTTMVKVDKILEEEEVDEVAVELEKMREVRKTTFKSYTESINCLDMEVEELRKKLRDNGRL